MKLLKCFFENYQQAKPFFRLGLLILMLSVANGCVQSPVVENPNQLSADAHQTDGNDKFQKIENSITETDNEQFKPKITTTLEMRGEIAYLPNNPLPFTGVFQKFYTNGMKEQEVNFNHGKENGSTTHWYENGQKRDEINFINGKQNGLVSAWHENGQKKAEIHYEDGKQNGLAISWYETGQKQAEKNYKDDKQISLSTHWYENGQKQAEANYEDGKQNGLATFWYENGQKDSETNYKDDKKNGLATAWYENGKKQEEGYFKENLQNGLGVSWYENGQKQGEMYFKDGKANGLATYWYENGEKRGLANYEDGVQNGLTIYWDENGQKREVNYKNGEAVEPKESSVEDNSRILCSSIALLAEQTMTARQAGTAMIKLMEANQTSEPISYELAENMIIAAYKIDRYKSFELQKRTIKNFRDKTYLQCVKTIKP